MPRSLYLSKSGLEQIRNVIGERGWAIYDVRWLIEVSRHMNLESSINWDNYLTWEKDTLEAEIASIATISKSTWRRFLERKSINTAAFIACCKALKVKCWMVADQVPTESSRYVIGIKAAYTDPEHYVGFIWTFILPEEENIDAPHLVSIYWGSWSWQQTMTLSHSGLLLKFVKRFPDLHMRTVVVSSPSTQKTKILVTSATKIINGHLDIPDNVPSIEIDWGWEQNWLTPPKVETLL